MRYVWMISITLISSFLLSGRSRCTVYRSLKSKVLLVLSASPVPFLSKTGFKTPLIVAANKSYWRLDESAKMWGGTLGPDRGKMRVWRKNAHVDMSGRFIRASRRARRGRGGALVALTNCSITLISSKLPLNVVFLC